jgi:hypothetical protein
MMAVTESTTFMSSRLVNVGSASGLIWFALTRTPAVTSSESPGRKNPISNPVSEKMIAIRTG